MNFYQNDYHPGMSPQNGQSSGNSKTPRRVPVAVFISVVCVLVAISILLTYTFTAELDRKTYTAQLQQQSAEIAALKAEAEKAASFGDTLGLLEKIFRNYSLYADELPEEEMADAALKAYTAASGDAYAEYYTAEKYKELSAKTQGEYCGIGVSVVQKIMTVQGISYPGFYVTAIYEEGTASKTDLRTGDFIYAVKADGEYQTVSALGYTAALNQVRGEEGTVAEFLVFRFDGDEATSIEFSITRSKFESVSVSGELCESDPSVGIVSLSEFILNTPVQFKAVMNDFRAKNVKHVVFDLRNNPGGDLQSILAVLSYMLPANSLLLTVNDRNGNVTKSHVVRAVQYGDEYAPCSVGIDEIGMYRDCFDYAVLCNENTASAAEVFTATLRDYGMATIVGTKTFGKGIMQSLIPLAYFGSQYSGYLKLTTYAFVTKCGVSYHGIGISPDEGYELELNLPEGMSIYELAQSDDNQLQKALTVFEQK